MKICIIGTGISGLTVAQQLANQHEITLFEAADYVGGHVNTVSVEVDARRYDIDTGFIVFNDRTYPNFCRLIDDLNVEVSSTSMSFSVRCDKTGLEYNGTSLNGVFAQRRNLLRPRFLRMLRDILKFNSDGSQDSYSVPIDQTVGEYIAEKNFSSEFAQQYLYPMGAAIWSCPVKQFERFPIRFILEFYLNHGLLSLVDRPQWKVVVGGSQRYIEKMIAPFRDRITLGCPVRAVRRHEGHVTVTHRFGTQQFDEVIFACHSDQALQLLEDADPLERELLSEFPYSSSVAVLHTDVSVLPKSRRAWASWNYHIPPVDDSQPTLTYNMNMLQNIRSEHTFCVTLNEQHKIDPRKVLASFKYSHPIFTVNRSRVQQRHGELIRRNRTSFCGAYWRNGFHEDGMVSGLAVSDAFALDRAVKSKNQLEAVQC